MLEPHLDSERLVADTINPLTESVTPLIHRRELPSALSPMIMIMIRDHREAPDLQLRCTAVHLIISFSSTASSFKFFASPRQDGLQEIERERKRENETEKERIT